MCTFAPTASLSHGRFSSGWKPRRALAVVLLIACAAVATIPTGHAQTITTVTTLHSFAGNTDGTYPVGPLFEGSDGNFYGTTCDGGPGYLGTIYKITPDGVFTVLHSFAPGNDGASPEGALIQTGDGTFYGTTAGYTSVDLDGGTTPGSIFKITPDSTFTTLFNSYGSPGGLVQGADGSFYGTNPFGANGFGEVFEITPDGEFTTLYEFTDGDDGGNPTAALVLASDGNFYGTTAGYNYSTETLAMNYGTVFRITPDGDFATVYRFTDGSDGASPGTALIQGRDGRLYGTTQAASGTIFALALDGSGFTILHTFTGNDGADANTLIQASDGNFYGTTGYGGANKVGTIFQLTPGGVLTTLYSFAGDPVDPQDIGEGISPMAALIQGSDGSLYGTASGGGATADGTVFKVTFSPAPSTFFTGEASVGDNVYYLSFAGGNYFGYYAFLGDPHYLYHLDLGFEYVFDAADGDDGVYFYDFTSSTFFYTSPTFPFPYLYDFTLNTFLYYYPDPNNPGHYNTNGVRYFYDFTTGKIITK